MRCGSSSARPATWAALAAITIASELALRMVPLLGPLLAEVVAPLVACGLVYAAATVDRGAKPALADAARAFRAPAGAIAAIVASALVTFVAEAAAAWWIAGVNLLDTAGAAADIRASVLIGIYAIGILASLPVMFVPFHVLLEPVAAGAAFAASWNAFALNAIPLIAYAGASLGCSRSASRRSVWDSCSPCPVDRLELTRPGRTFSGFGDAPGP
jgi:hypothetical protein